MERLFANTPLVKVASVDLYSLKFLTRLRGSQASNQKF
jgi:hypothetical protein